MALTDKDIAQFAKSAVEYDPAVLRLKDEAKRAKLLAECRRNALAYYEQAQADVKGSGYRVTQRVRDAIWAELKRIADAG